MKKSVLLLIVLMTAVLAMTAVLPVAAIDDNDHKSVEEQVPPDEAAATPVKGENGEELAFTVGEPESGNSPAGIVMMVGIFGICLFFCFEGVFSYIKKARKRSAEQFEQIKKD